MKEVEQDVQAISDRIAEFEQEKHRQEQLRERLKLKTDERDQDYKNAEKALQDHDENQNDLGRRLQEAINKFQNQQVRTLHILTRISINSYSDREPVHSRNDQVGRSQY